MGRIAVLDRNMINMIAAGEVIERPASVVKELLENSIDAGAKSVSIGVEDGGRRLISVSDNGCGMDAEDLARAFEPHSTSKVRTKADLAGISTLGFRGEALASIASISRLKAVSRQPDSNEAHCVEIDCGRRGEVAPCSADYGTTIQVRDIFYKLPARRKFLRTANTEMGHISEQFTRVALANGGLDLVLTHNGRESYRLSAGEGLRRRIGQLFPMLSADASGELLEVQSEEKGLRIYGLIGGPSLSRNNSKFQYVFLNGRFIRDKFVSHAIREAYRGSIENDRHAVVFLFIEMPYEDYDVNVHPTKIEVRFYNSNLVHSQILGCLREKLLSIDLGVHGRLPSPVRSVPRVSTTGAGHRSREVADAMAEFFKRHKPSHIQRRFEMETGGGQRPAREDAESASADSSLSDSATDRDIERKFMQIHDSFIVAQSDEGLMIIDQHALHERIMYEMLSDRVRQSGLQSQRLLIPESFEVTEAEAAILESNAELIEKLGIDVVPFGPRTIAVQAFPSLLSKASCVEFMRELMGLIDEQGPTLDGESLLDEVLNMAACKAAIKAGQRLKDREIEQLLSDAEGTDFANRCPHGRPTTIKFSWTELEKQFKRT